MTLRHTLAVLMLTLTAACASGERLHTFRSSSGGPEEFAVLPNRPLEMPAQATTLPAPTPGGANRADLTPKADAVAALGGRPAALTETAIPASDAGLVSYTARNGIDPAVRQDLAQTDASFRRRQALLTRIRIVNDDRYYPVYRRQSLNSQAEAGRWRRAGAPTPTAPPLER